MKLIEIRELSHISDNVCLSMPEDVAKYCIEVLEFETLASEHLYCFCLNAKNMVKSIELISKGSLTCSIVHPREVFKAAILSNSAAIILAHNHPSGNSDPSLDDLEITKRIKKGGEILGIRLIDHIIIGKNEYLSMQTRGLI